MDDLEGRTLPVILRRLIKQDRCANAGRKGTTVLTVVPAADDGADDPAGPATAGPWSTSSSARARVGCWPRPCRPSRPGGCFRQFGDRHGEGQVVTSLGWR